MATIHHQVAIDAPPANVYAAIATADGISTWWDKQTAVNSERRPGPRAQPRPGARRGQAPGGRARPEQASGSSGEFFESNKTAWGQVLEDRKRVLEARRG